MTWAEFKAEVERQGAKDTHKLAWIDQAWDGKLTVADHERWVEQLKDQRIDDSTRAVCIASAI